MATVLEQYKLRQSAWNAQSGAGKLPVDALVPMLELNYRVDVIDTFQTICQTAEESLQKVVRENRRQFSSFKANTPEQYKGAICKLVNTFLPIWLQYRETYIHIQLQ